MKSINNLKYRYRFLLFFLVIFLGLCVDLPNLWNDSAKWHELLSIGIPANQCDLFSEACVLGDASNRATGTNAWLSDIYTPINNNDFCNKRNPYWLYINDSFKYCERFYQRKIYKSNIVAQRFFVYFLEKYMGLNRQNVLLIAFVSSAALAAACISIVVLWLAKRVGAKPMLVIVILACLGSISFTRSGKSLYWQMWTLYAPLAMTCIFCDGILSQFRIFRGKMMWLIWMFVLLTAKMACYFELMTTVIMSAFVPCVLKGLEEKSLFRRLLSSYVWSMQQ